MEACMSHLESFSSTAFLIGDNVRAAMLTALLDGRALPAGELAYASGVTAQTASSHLAKLLGGGLIAVEREGRHRYYRLAGPHVAQALEYLAAIRPQESIRRKALSLKGRELRFCRCCYDHLAGQVGIAVTQALERRDYIRPVADKEFEVTQAGIQWFHGIGLDICSIKSKRKGLARQCLDWTERRPHLAGPLGVHFMTVLCATGWLRRLPVSRVVHVTPKGWAEFKRHLNLRPDLASDSIGLENAPGEKCSTRNA
jgi:DNA-binding transcriptional ArsR family regulator